MKKKTWRRVKVQPDGTVYETMWMHQIDGSTMLDSWLTVHARFLVLDLPSLKVFEFKGARRVSDVWIWVRQ